MIVALDIGHRGKRSRPADRGATGSIGGVAVEEVALVSRYVEAADRELRRLGHIVYVMGDGEYSERWARAHALRADVYVQGHVNAGGGDRGEVFFDYRSSRGKALAGRVAAELGKVYPWTSHAKACRPDDDGEPRDEDYSEAYGCIRGVYELRPVGLVVEPYFIDGPRAVAWWRDLELTGIALARGIDAWGKG